MGRVLLFRRSEQRYIFAIGGRREPQAQLEATVRGKTTGKSDNIRAVERAIDLLQALNRRPLSTLHDLHRDTGLPKPSIVRLLRTLEAKGLAAQASSYGTYQLLGRVKSLASGFHPEPAIIEAA